MVSELGPGEVVESAVVSEGVEALVVEGEEGFVMSEPRCDRHRGPKPAFMRLYERDAEDGSPCPVRPQPNRMHDTTGTLGAILSRSNSTASRSFSRARRYAGAEEPCSGHCRTMPGHTSQLPRQGSSRPGGGIVGPDPGAREIAHDLPMQVTDRAVRGPHVGDESRPAAARYRRLEARHLLDEMEGLLLE